MKIASRATPEGLAGHGLSTTVLSGQGTPARTTRQTYQHLGLLLVSQTSERHSHSLENEIRLIAMTLHITNEQNGEKGKLEKTI